jgi:hypothetical protein
LRILEASSVSYGKTTSYLPVIDLLKGYFRIGARDPHREIREKMTGKLLTLDCALEPTVPALLALLDVPGAFTESLASCREGLEIANRVEQPYTMLIAHLWLGMAHLRKGEVGGASPAVGRVGCLADVWCGSLLRRPAAALAGWLPWARLVPRRLGPAGGPNRRAPCTPIHGGLPMPDLPTPEAAPASRCSNERHPREGPGARRGVSVEGWPARGT